MGTVTSIWETLKQKARSVGLPEHTLVLDLNAVKRQNLGIKWGEETLIIRPLSTIDYLEAVEALAQLEALGSKSALTPSEVLEAYGFFFSKICPEITREMIGRLQHQDLIRLRQLCVDVITGKAYLAPEVEKKTPPTNLKG